MPRWSFENKITLGNLVQIVLIVGGFIYGYATLSGTVTQSAEAVKSIPAIETRLTKVEVNQTNGRAERLQQQEDLKDAVKELQNATNKRLDKMDDTVLVLAKAVAGLDATLRAMEK